MTRCRSPASWWKGFRSRRCGAPTGRTRTSRRFRMIISWSIFWRRLLLRKRKEKPFLSTTRRGSMASRLKDKVALVIGAGSVGPGWGNGRATTVRFVEEGAKVYAVDFSEANLKETIAKAPSIKTQIGDVTKSKDVAAMVRGCLDAFGRIDILVNNVGGSAPGGPVEMSEEVWDRQMEYNLKSVFLTCKHVLPVMEKQGGGAIVNLSSTSGVRYSGSPHIAYVAAKAGIRQFSQALAAQYAPKGIRVNTVIPGQLHTPMVEARLAKDRTGGDVDKLLKDRLSRIPIGFAGDGRDTANAILFLASDEARFITGAEIIMDGGMTIVTR